MSSPTKIITVFGATGNQGSSVIKTLLSHPSLASQYHIRGITRDVNKPSAQALRSQGVEPIQADLSDPTSLRLALKDSHSVFAVTNYWDTMSKENEIQQGKNIVDACLSSDSAVQHLILSTLPNVTQLTNNQLTNVEHFDSKAEVSAYAEAHKKSPSSNKNLIVTHFMPGYFSSNIKSTISIDPSSGLPTCMLPFDRTATKVPLFSPRDDTGPYVVGALVLSAAADGAFIQAVSDWKTPAEIVSVITHYNRGTPEVQFKELPADVWAKFLPLPEHAQIEMAENMILVKDWSYFGKGAEKLQKEIDEKFLLKGEKKVGWEEFVKRNGPWEWK
ncbi:putative family transcriptional regulator [Phaeomoniella chlamydospora]|uniref:Putative family transcriptional regulator n=1 Tax=Phaeomoniella chlamydospora TaxID=158046 RepID=A0A0G2H1H6_PHACM|nr:putative family transcriptional regulator [Phaeomoniella chlamydospora]